MLTGVRLEAWDSVFVRSARADVHDVVADVAAYGGWWPGLRVEPLVGGALRCRHRPPGVLGRRHTVDSRLVEERPGLGLRLAYLGDLDGQAEWYYLDEVDGVVVHYLLRAGARPRGARRLLAAHRASVRAAMHALKDRLEGDRLPGDEPDPRLVAHQARAAAGGGARPAGDHQSTAARRPDDRPGQPDER